jgi:CheY-like chemotaxis protein
VNEPPAGTSIGTILLAENDLALLTDTTELLRDRGYTVIEAQSGAMALQQVRSALRIDLLFIGTGIPGTESRQVIDEGLRVRPGLRLLCAVSHPAVAAAHDDKLDSDLQVILQPFTPLELARRIRTFLGDRGGNPIF